MGNSVSPSPACASKHTWFMGKSTLFVGKVACSAGSEWDCSSKRQGFAGPDSLVQQSANDTGPERMPLEVTHWKFPQRVTVPDPLKNLNSANIVGIKFFKNGYAIITVAFQCLFSVLRPQQELWNSCVFPLALTLKVFAGSFKHFYKYCKTGSH